MTLLEIENLNLGFNLSDGFKQVIYDVSLSVDSGKMLALVGESGCGKTLTAMSILNLLPELAEIKSGQVLFKNENLLQKSDFQMQKIRGKNIALIPQDPMTALNPLYTIENQLLEVIKLNQPEAKNPKEIAIKALEEVKIPNAKERMKSYPHELSGGMKQRIIIAMALSCNADLIIADEPTTALDVTVQAQIMKLLNEIKENKKTAIILITHDLGVVYENADEIAVMYAGRVAERAKKDDLFKNPLHPYTKALFRSLPDLSGNKLAPIDGQPPSIDEKVSGCPFHPRCSEKLDDCSVKNPELMTVNNTKVACWLYK